MLDLKDGFVLYHGSYCEVKEQILPNVQREKILGRKKAGNLFQISCLVCRFVGGGYLVVKVREQVDPMCEWQT